jgi:hypothetical protein
MLRTTSKTSDQIQIQTTQQVQDTDTTCMCGILTSVSITKEFYYAGIRLLTIFPYHQWFTSLYKPIYASVKILFITSFRMCTRIFALQIDNYDVFILIHVFETNIIFWQGMLHTRDSVLLRMCRI